MHPALFNLGFRPFFLGAAGFAAATMLTWLAVFSGRLHLQFEHLAPSQWHAHEMVYGYAVAVIAGFLLTAVRNWTGVDTPRGWPLAALCALWLAARLLLLSGTGYLPIAAVIDVAFQLLLLVSVAWPIIRVRQYRQVGILSKLTLMLAGNAVFYIGVTQGLPELVRISLYGGFYLVIALILTMARRLVPFFTRSALGLELPNHRLVDLTSLLGLLVFFLAELARPASTISDGAAAVVCLANAIRLVRWNHPQVWRVPMLWSLFVALWCITAGFALVAAAEMLAIPRLIGLHAMAVGGIGIVTVGMMGRVAVGHTGRNLSHPPRLYTVAIVLLLAAAAVRVLLPLVVPVWYLQSILLSGALWIAGFSLFTLAYAPMLCGPRVDGQYG